VAPAVAFDDVTSLYAASGSTMAAKAAKVIGGV
jgi:hypothetical protein